MNGWMDIYNVNQFLRRVIAMLHVHLYSSTYAKRQVT